MQRTQLDDEYRHAGLRSNPLIPNPADNAATKPAVHQSVLKRLAAFQRQNQLDFALQELGRIERSLFMLDWLESPQLRQMCQAGLNKSEQRHALAQVICTFKQGRIADRGPDAQEFRASGLNLVIAAIVYWNSTYLADAIDHLRCQRHRVPAELLAHTSPLTISDSPATFCGTRPQQQPGNGDP
jgi:TnpA family transposase